MNYPPTSLTLFSHSHSVRLIAFCLLIFAAASASANSVDTLEFHEVVSADTFAGVITQPRDSLDDYRSLHWQFSALGRDFTLRLTRSTLADSATVVKRGSVSNQTGRDTTSVRRTPPKELPLLVRGQVEGDPDSAVRGTLDHDGFTGWLLTRGQQYYLERSQQLSLPGEDRLVMYRRDQQAVGVTLHDDMRSLSISNSNFAGPGSTVTRSQIPLTGRHGVTRTLSIGIVVDSLYHQQR
ncbi:MAG: hypothetical protein KTR33_07395, partial [Gammaproteobacteria bacterium]|nr:hypothetical protein [Gammaproteobacteria bacterium]